MIFDPVVILMMYLYRSYNVGSGGFLEKVRGPEFADRFRNSQVLFADSMARRENFDT